jgi:hypothetical protein
LDLLFSRYPLSFKREASYAELSTGLQSEIEPLVLLVGLPTAPLVAQPEAAE